MLTETNRDRPDLGRNLTVGLVELIGRNIITGAYTEAGFPTEAKISESQGVSRSVTREAMKMLTAKGLLSARPRQGTIVQPSASWNLFDGDVLRWLLDRRFVPELLLQFSQLRLAIEPEGAALAARNDEPEARGAIRAGLERMKAAARGEDDALEADIAFHSAIMAAANNPFFLQLQTFVSTALRSSIRLTNRVKGELINIRDHEKIALSIERDDADGAREAMRALIQEVIDTISSANKGV